MENVDKGVKRENFRASIFFEVGGRIRRRNGEGRKGGA